NEVKVNDYPVKDASTPFHIGTLHGSVYGDQEHDTYAPFQLKQLQDKDYDYWALGHIHQRKVLAEEPPIIYPGNIQGRHRKETAEKGCYYVQLSNHSTKTTFIPLQAIQFLDMTLDISNCEKVEEVETLIRKQLRKYSDTKFLVHITWKSTSEKWM